MTVSESGTSPVVVGGNDGFGFGSGGFIWAFLIFALLMGGGGFGGWGNNNAIGYENLATSNEVQRGFDNQNTMANQREILSAVNAGTAQSVAATNQTFHDTASLLSDKYSELQRDIASVQVSQANALANQNECCSSTKMVLADGFAQTNANIAQNRYESAMNTAAINATTTAQTQKILDSYGSYPVTIPAIPLVMPNAKIIKITSSDINRLVSYMTPNQNIQQTD